MSRSIKDEVGKKQYWVGYDVQPVTLQRQSKYSTEWMYKDSADCYEDLGDYKYSRYDMDWDLDTNDNDNKGETT